MTDRVQIVALAGSVLLLLLVLELVRRRRLAEEYSALWILSALALIGISLRRDVLHFAATWLGIYYPPALLVLALVAIISVASLSFSVILSRQQRQIDWLIEENAVMAAELRDLRDRDASPHPDARAGSQQVADRASGTAAGRLQRPNGPGDPGQGAVPVESWTSRPSITAVASRDVIANPAQRSADSRRE